MASGAVGAGELHALAEVLEGHRVASRAQVEVAPEDERVAVRPGHRVLGCPHHLGRGTLGQARGRMQVRGTHPPLRKLEPRPVHAPLLGPVGERQAAPLEHPSGSAHEHLVRAAVRGREQVRVPVGEWALQGLAPIARGPDEHAVRTGARTQRAKPARRRLLEEGQVPLEPVEHVPELVEERPVDLGVRLVSLGLPQQPAAPREQGRVRREVAPVVEVPAEDPHGKALPNR